MGMGPSLPREEGRESRPSGGSDGAVVIQPLTAIRDAVAKLDSAFGYADGYDGATASYTGLVVAKSPPVMLAPSAVIVRADVAFEHAKKTGASTGVLPTGGRDGGVSTGPGTVDESAVPRR